MYTLADLGLIDGPSDPAWSHLVKMASRVCGVQAGMLSILDGFSSTVQVMAHCGLGPMHEDTYAYPADGSLTRLVHARRELIAVDDARKDPEVSHGCSATNFGFRGMMGAPLNGPDGEPVGALTVYSQRACDWTDGQRESLESMAYLANQHVMHRASRATIRILTQEAGLKTA